MKYKAQELKAKIAQSSRSTINSDEIKRILNTIINNHTQTTNSESTITEEQALVEDLLHTISLMIEIQSEDRIVIEELRQQVEILNSDLEELRLYTFHRKISDYAGWCHSRIFEKTTISEYAKADDELYTEFCKTVRKLAYDDSLYGKAKESLNEEQVKQRQGFENALSEMPVHKMFIKAASDLNLDFFFLNNYRYDRNCISHTGNKYLRPYQIKENIKEARDLLWTIDKIPKKYREGIEEMGKWIDIYEKDKRIY